MVKYYARVPSAAAKPYPDGHCYAYVDLEMVAIPGKKVTVLESVYPILRRVSRNLNGEASVYLGCAGEAIANTVNLPFGVTVEIER